MSVADATSITVGGSATPDNNLKIISNDNGTFTIQTAGGARTIMTVDAAGNINAGVARSMVRVNTANGYGSTNTKIRRFTNVVTNQGTDITYADSATLGASFTINTNGVYAISYTDQFNTASGNGISLNSTQLTTSVASITASNRLSGAVNATGYAMTCGCTLSLVVGDVIRPHTAGDPSGTNTWAELFTITRVG